MSKSNQEVFTMKSIALFTYLLLVFGCAVHAQESLSLSLDEAIRRGMEESPDASIVRNNYQVEWN